MKKLFVFLLVCSLAVANLSAQAVDKEVCPGFTINSTAAATSGSTYRWLENGSVISGATAANYTIPTTKTTGVYTYVRQSKSGSCSDWQGSNAYTVSVVAGCLTVNGITWADMNVDAPYTFASRADMYTQFYKFQSKTGYHATSPGNGIAYGSGWSSNESADWPYDSPCPGGWRVPSINEWSALNATGSTWANAYNRGNAVAGRFFGPNHASCSLPSNMTGCIFLPAVGNRNNNDGALNNQGSEGYYWAAEWRGSGGYGANFNSSDSMPSYYEPGRGFSIRCVKDN